MQQYILLFPFLEKKKNESMQNILNILYVCMYVCGLRKSYNWDHTTGCPVERELQDNTTHSS